MTSRGRPKAELALAEAERRTLEDWAGRAVGERLALRARIVLASAEGLSNQDVATKFGVGLHTVGKWRARFVAGRLAGLFDGPRPGAGRRITDAQIDAVLIRTLQTAPPAGAELWSTRAMAAVAGLNQTAVSRLWRAAGLRPHQVATWRLFQDPRFAQLVRAVAGLRITSADRILALAAERGRPSPTPGRRTSAVRAADDPGRRHLLDPVRALPLAPAGLTDNSGQGTVCDFLDALNARVPPEWDVHVACAGPAAREQRVVRAWLSAHRRFHLHPVPVPQTWQRLLERWAGRLGRSPDLVGLAAALGAWSGEPLVWFPPSLTAGRPAAGGDRVGTRFSSGAAR
ncbi:helix-turn-helix domain-containing protein [Micromonospora sp. NPDC000089]|uniref:helix-turn-helix domain-containing protein n=1 Tax=unclassified Micromonospora TaxID=2617518 RepID=UPI003684D545